MTYQTTAQIPSRIARGEYFTSSNFFGTTHNRWSRFEFVAGLATNDQPIMQAAIDYVLQDTNGTRYLYVVFSYERPLAWQIREYDYPNRTLNYKPFYFASPRYGLCSRSQRAQEKHLRLIELGQLLQEHTPTRATLTSVA